VTASLAASKATYPSLITQAIKERIQNGELRPGQWIRQDDLAAQLGVSRIPIREALYSMASAGLIVLLAHRGAQIAPVSIEGMEEIERLRAILEREALERAAQHPDEATLSAAGDALEAMEYALARGKREDFYPSNEVFHFAMFDAAGSPRLSGMIRSLWTAWIPYRGLFYVDRPAHFGVLQREHRAMLRSLKKGDGKHLSDLQHAHRGAAVSYLRRSLTLPQVEKAMAVPGKRAKK